MPSPLLRPRRLAAALAVLGLGASALAGFALPAAAAAAPTVVINEVESDGDAVDWIELTNVSGTAVDISGWVIKDNDDARTDVVPAGTVLAAGGYYVFAEPAMSFGLGKADAARLFLPDGTTLVDGYSWTQHAAVAFGRCPDGVGAFVNTTTSTRGAANDCSTPTPTPAPTDTTPPASVPAAGALVMNEIESNGDDTDWFELFNTTTAPIDISGFIVRDNDDSKRYELPSGSIVPARGILLVDQQSATTPGFDFGLGGNDQVRLFAPDGTTLVAQASWATHATTSYGLCPDGVGELTSTTSTTKGTPNDCSLPVSINEVESSGGTPGDWIELVNRSDAEISVAGLVVTDSDVAGHRYVIPAGTTIAAKGYLVLDESAFSFGLGGTDAVHLFDVDGVTELDATSWSGHAEFTWGRCPDAAGEFAATSAATKGATNVCAGQIVVETWPGGASTRAVDAEADFTGDLSGLDYADGGLWAVENGNGLLYRLVRDGDGWTPASGWADGVKLRYPNGGGTVDAEGVTAVGSSVYVSSERNNDVGSISRPSVLRYAPQAGGDLVAEAEWNLAADFAGLGANAGLEGITWIADSWLVAEGFVDQRTSAAYDPATYVGHGDGLLFVGVEGTAEVYAYALNADGTFARVATIASGFGLVADVQFDRGLLWVVCDEACDGRTATFEIDADGAFTATHVYERPAGMANVANEGFAIADTCAGGFAETFYADDADTDGFSLRTGTLACTTGTTPGTPEPEPTPDPSPTPDPTATPGPSPDPTVTPGPTPGPTGTPAPTGTPTLPATGAGAPDAASLTDVTRGGLTAPSSARPGDPVTLTVPLATPGQNTQVWMFSTPTDLGTATVSAARTVTATVPATITPGAHRIVVTAADGTILGWTEITVTDPGGALAVTGGDSSVLPIVVIGAVVLGAAGAGMVRRARRTAQD